MKIKKYVIRAIFLLPILLGVIYFWYRVPWGFHKEFEGIYYKPGDPSFSEKVTISFDGYLQRGVWQDEANKNHNNWSVEDGYVISAPADNRSEALKLSKDLASVWLEGSKER